MNVEKVKTKPIMEYGSGGGAMEVGKKIIIYLQETQDLTINEVAKIEEFFKSLRT